jgi:hypothetical protein
MQSTDPFAADMAGKEDRAPSPDLKAGPLGLGLFNWRDVVSCFVSDRDSIQV